LLRSFAIPTVVIGRSRIRERKARNVGEDERDDSTADRAD
jgi:hypothetical protein